MGKKKWRPAANWTGSDRKEANEKERVKKRNRYRFFFRILQSLKWKKEVYGKCIYYRTYTIGIYTVCSNSTFFKCMWRSCMYSQNMFNRKFCSRIRCLENRITFLGMESVHYTCTYLFVFLWNYLYIFILNVFSTCFLYTLS